MKPRLFWKIAVFFIMITIVRLIWYSTLDTSHHPLPSKGTLDLRNAELPTNRTISLNGEWGFYPNQLLSPTEIANLEDKEIEFKRYPEDWVAFSNSNLSEYKTATLQLRILLNKDHQTGFYGIQIFDIPTASKIYVNGELLGNSGNPATDISQYLAKKNPYSVSFSAGQEVDILIHVANQGYPINPNNLAPIKFGYDSALTKESTYATAFQIIALTIFFTLAVYTILLYFIGGRTKTLIYFFFLILSAMGMVLLEYDLILLNPLSLTYEHSAKVVYFVFTCIGMFIILYFKHLLPMYSQRKVFKWFPITCLVYLLLIVILPTKYILGVPFLLGFFLLVPAITVAIQFGRAVADSIEDVIYLLLGAVSIGNNIVWSIVGNRIPYDLGFYPWDLLLTLFLLSAFWFKRYFRNADKTKKLSDELLKADKKKDEFLANTSHELRNPLHSMINIAQSVSDNKKNLLEEQDRKDLDLLITVGKRMSLMVNDLLDLSLLQEKRIHLNIKPVRLDAITFAVIDMLTHMTKGKPVQLRNEIPASFPFVLADENRVTQILLNLIHNAIKYTYDGEILIRSSVLDQTAFIHVKDTGIGIDKHVQKSIFSPYEQGDDRTIKNSGGLGLGLAICKQLVELHGGKLSVTSSMNEGSTFTFTLPVATTSKNVLTDPLTSHHPINISPFNLEKEMSPELNFRKSSKPKLLLVDDEPVNLHVLKKILSSEQYDMVVATSGYEALEKLDAGSWDLVISDAMMPQMSGYELTKKIRERYDVSELPILLVTARSHPEDLATGFLTGANDYISKPVDPLELRARVQLLTDLKISIAEHLHMEAAWLQAQIKPHFFFNTLNTIMSLLDVDLNKAKRTFEAFCDYLQTSFHIQSSDQLIPLQDELDLVRAYVTIEQERFLGKLEIIWEIDAVSHCAMIPPLSIQTIVENAVHHGILKRYEGGVIKIIAYCENNDIVIKIIDNGVGMDENKICSLLKMEKDPANGIGLYNTNRRLKQLYGYGLTIESKVNQGTTVSFRIPVRVKETKSSVPEIHSNCGEVTF